ncbi:MAG: N-acetylmuramoyl-L-alanine amidase, partial [Sphingomonadaceae bacterium]|nr:N-acetylmuramoyl-L-alanine amidase [Sphingomonadaceae bacterium]
RPLVVIDAGHGGHDPGAISPFGSRREEDATLAISLQLRDALIASGRVRVALTREDDRYLVHRERYEIARRLDAALFISVHIDSAPNPEARGATVYTLSEVASDREAALLARRENSSDIINGIDLGGEDAAVRSILIDLTQRETLNVSARFANLLDRVGGEYIGFKPDHHRFASLAVLKAPDVPSVLFEAGYLTNAAEAEIVFGRAGQRRIAQGLARAIETHFARAIAVAD